MTKPARAKPLRRLFQTTAAMAVIGGAPLTMGAMAQEGPRPYSSGGVAGNFHRDQGTCPVRGENERPVTVPFNFASDPREQMRLFESIGFFIGRETPDGIFRERTLQSVNEWRILYYGFERAGDVPFAQSLTASELSDLREFSARVQRERRTYNLTLENAVALRFAARATNAVHADLVTETDRGRSGFSGSTASFLYLVKTQGQKYGLGWFVDQISMTTAANGTVSVRVNDPATFLLLEDLKRHPRIALMMQAEQIRMGETMPLTEYTRGTPPQGIQLNRLQGDLLALGFNIGGIDGDFGPKTEASYNLYRALYGPLVPQGQDVDAYMSHFADLAQRDARSYGISTTAAAAIRLGSLRTGVDFEYMMELSAAESNFDPSISASTSSATGLYQFTEDTWLQTIRRYGQAYGMGHLANQMSNTYDMNGMLVGRVENPFIRTTSFDLRKQPHMMALLAAEFQQRNQFRITCAVPRALTRTEMYLGHFLGAEGAISFIENRARNPQGRAASAFAQQAAANRNVFYSRDRRGRYVARSYNEVYAFFERKFGRGVYRDNGNAASLQLRTPHEAHLAATAAAGTQTAANDTTPLQRFAASFTARLPWNRG